MTMKKKKIYLSGASGNVSHEERTGWRLYCKEYLEMSDKFEVFDPNDSFTYEEDADLPMKVIMDYYLKDVIPSCDIILVNLNECNRSIGTAMEIGSALAMNKFVIGIAGENYYPYIQESCSYVCRNYVEACDFIQAHFSN